MLSSAADISFVIPCYNESERFHYIYRAFEEFDNVWNVPYEIVLVNDGSGDDTWQLAQAFQQQWNREGVSVKVINVQPNQGKGNALRTGVAAATREWILTLDADMAAYPINVLHWLQDKKAFDKNSVYIGSRNHPGSKVEAHLLRKVVGSVFNFATRILISLKLNDTQCGFKLYPANAAKDVFSEIVTLGWAHDIEILARLQRKGYHIVAMPLEWEHREGAKINVFQDGVNMFFQTVRISWILRREKK